MTAFTTPTFTRQDGPPLHPRILYNRPITRQGAGRLLTLGGHTGEFSQPALLYQFAQAAGIGECIVALPDALVKFTGALPGVAYVASSPSGSLGTEALGRLLQLSEEADAVAIGTSLSRNSHTAILIEHLLQELEQPIIIFDDGLSALQHQTRLFTERTNCLVVLTMPEVFRLAGQLGLPLHIRPDGGLLNKLEIVRTLSAATSCSYVVYGSEIITAQGAELTVTPVNYRLSLIPSLYWAVFSVFWLQNPAQRYPGIVTAAYLLREVGATLGPEEHPTAATLGQTLASLLEQS